MTCLDLARSVAPYFRIDNQQAESIIEQAKDAVSDWKSIASDLDIPRSEQSMMAAAFAVD